MAARKLTEEQRLAVASVNLAMRQGIISAVSGIAHVDGGHEVAYTVLEIKIDDTRISAQQRGRLMQSLMEVSRVGSTRQSGDTYHSFEIRDVMSGTHKSSLKALAEMGVEFPGAEGYKTKHVTPLR